MVAGVRLPELPRKPLSPGFRLAILNGSISSVQTHLASGSDVRSADEKGRSPLMLAADRGRLDVCRLLVEAGADPALTDHDGNDAVAVARLKGHVDVVDFLTGASSIPQSDSDVSEAAVYEARNTHASAAADHTDFHDIDDTIDVGQAASTSALDAVSEILTTSCQPYDQIDGDVWQQEITPPAPPDNPSCAQSSSRLQDVLTRHQAVDLDESWNDVEIELPDIAYANSSIGVDQQRAIRLLLLEAIRDGRILENRISSAISEAAQDESDTFSGAEWAASLRLVLSDLGIIIDDEVEAPDAVLAADENDEAQFGDTATSAFAWFQKHQSDDSDVLSLYLKSLPTGRLDHEDVIRLGKAVDQSTRDVLAIVTACPEVVATLRADAEAVLSGQLSVHSMLDRMGDPSGMDATEDDDFDVLAGINSACLDALTGRSQLATSRFLSELSEEYLLRLQNIAISSDKTGNTRERLRAAAEKAKAAREQLVRANLRLVIWVARRYGGLTLADRIQEGNLGLMRAARKYDYRRGTKFSSYAVWWIRQAISRAVADLARTIRLPVHVHESLRRVEKARHRIETETGLEAQPSQIATVTELSEQQVGKLLRVPDEPLSIDPELELSIEGLADESSPNAEEALLHLDMRIQVRRHLAILTAREELVIRYRFGIGCDEHTLEEVGQIYGVTRERIRQIEAKAMRKLGHASHIRRLRSLLR
jgi:RNA polymerase primary sigma factor